MRIVILGPDGAGKSAVLQGIAHSAHLGRVLRTRHLKPRFIAPRRVPADMIIVDPHGQPPRSAFFSIAKILVWLLEEWCARLWQENSGTLLLCDRYYHDLLIDPKRYRYGGPLWAARLVGRAMPQPALWILLDAPASLLQTRKQEVAPQETARQCHAYRAFVLQQRRRAIVDGALPLEQVIAAVERAIAQVSD